MAKAATMHDHRVGTALARKTAADATGLRTAEAQILGQSLASLGHDIQNHLATINESAGWMKDLLEQRDKRGFDRVLHFFKRVQTLEKEPLLLGLDVIQKRVSQVAVLARRLSSFAHCLAEEKSVWDANKVLGEIMDVLLKEAQEKNIHLEVKQTKEVCMIEIDPFGFQVAVFEILTRITKNLESGARVILETTVQDREFHVCFTVPNDRENSNSSAREPDSQDFLRYMVDDLDGRIRQHSGNKQSFNTLSFVLAGG